MANAITGPAPWRVDTVPQIISTGKVKIESIYWFRPTDITHTFVIHDRTGKIIFQGQCEVANQSQYFRVENWFDGMTVTTLGSGVLYIYFD